MTIEQAKSAINAVYEPAYANYIIMALTGERYEDENGNFVECKPCEDCISRTETIDYLKKVTVTDGITFETGFKQILYDIEQMPSVQPINQNIKALGEELRTFRGGIKDEKVLTGFNMAIALCNKHLTDTRGTE